MVNQLSYVSGIGKNLQLSISIDKGEAKASVSKSLELPLNDFLKGYRFDQLSIIVSRICGICGPIHAIAALNAVENAFNINISLQTKLLRELLCLGSTLHSHVTHLYFNVLPDYVNMPIYRKRVNQFLKLKKLASEIITTIGGSLHPITSRISGFSSLPTVDKLNSLLRDLKNAKNDVQDFIKVFNGLKYPKFEQKTRYFALQDNMYFSMLGDIVSFDSKLSIKNYKQYLEFSKKNNCRVGALARINLNKSLLPKTLKLFKTPNYNPFMNNVALAIECAYVVNRAIEILESLEIKQEGTIKFNPRNGVGIGIIESPNGLLFHEYSFNKSGLVTKSEITTPSMQNLNGFEHDLNAFLHGMIKKPKELIISNIGKLANAYGFCNYCLI